MTAQAITVYVQRAAFFSTHHASATDALAATERPPTSPTYPLLVARARRFTSLATQMHLEVCGALTDVAKDLPAIFATAHGEIDTADKLIADFHANAVVSSAKFALSVHNSPSGVYSVATHNTAATTTITGANAFAGGWLEAALTALDSDKPVLLSLADEPIPAPFHGPRATGVAAAFVLSPHGPGRRAELAIVPDIVGDVDPVTTLAHAAGPAATTVVLGAIQTGAVLQLTLEAVA